MTAPRRALLLGANGLIGEAIATALAGPDTLLTIAARDESRLHALADRLHGGGTVRVDAVDVRDDDAVAALVERAAGADGLDVAVNNVGTAHRPAPLDRLDIDEIDRVLAVALRGIAVAISTSWPPWPTAACSSTSPPPPGWVARQ